MILPLPASEPGHCSPRSRTTAVAAQVIVIPSPPPLARRSLSGLRAASPSQPTACNPLMLCITGNMTWALIYLGLQAALASFKVWTCLTRDQDRGCAGSGHCHPCLRGHSRSGLRAATLRQPTACTHSQFLYYNLRCLLDNAAAWTCRLPAPTTKAAHALPGKGQGLWLQQAIPVLASSV